ncbi:MAG: radical SAM protein [Myxococcales bacterium]|nr:radical SAM protein [Myxococcales bacterium]
MSHSSGPKHTSAAKAPIIFDDHTDLSKIELQYFIDTRVGKQTCQARCEFCWLDRDNVRGFHQDVDEAARVITRLREQGFKVVPIVSDSFAERGKYLRSGLLNNNNDWYMGNAAWSSGRPLLGDDHEALLDLCVDNGIHTIIMTSHGTEDRERAFKGLTQPSVVREAVRRIQAYSARAGWEFRIILTFTLSARNPTW